MVVRYSGGGGGGGGAVLGFYSITIRYVCTLQSYHQAPTAIRYIVNKIFVEISEAHIIIESLASSIIIPLLYNYKRLDLK